MEDTKKVQAETPFKVEKFDSGNEIDPIERMLQAYRMGGNVDPEEKYNERMGVTYYLEPISDAKFEELSDQATKNYLYGGTLQPRLEPSKFNRLLVAEATKVLINGKPVSPFKAENVVKLFGSPEKAVQSILFTGEITDYAQIIMRLSRFSPELIDQGTVAQKVKNS